MLDMTDEAKMLFYMAHSICDREKRKNYHIGALVFLLVVVVLCGMMLDIVKVPVY